ncbi:MAG: hypothetical protein JNM56_04145 [Planctomycetia bacterium]|nr:hypothetical protein [Planctomycetia bacterium]
MDELILGATAMAFAVASLFFLRFWRDTGDRLFALFAFAFLLMSCGRVGFGLTQDQEEAHPYLYLLRFFSFSLIVVAIVDKNRSRPPSA